MSEVKYQFLFLEGPGAKTRRGVRKAESMKVTSLTGRTVITTELPTRCNSNGHAYKPDREMKDDEQASSSQVTVDGAISLPSTSEVTKIDDKSSESVGSSSEPVKSVAMKTSISGGLPDNRPKNIHARSASLPANVRVRHADANAKDVSSSSSVSPRADKKATRNKSFAGMTKTSHVKKPPLDIFSLPETDVDSGISVACERPTSGRASKRNLRIMDLMRNSKEPEKKTEQPKRDKKRGQLKSEKTSGKSTGPTPARPDIRVPPNAPYAPNFLETDLDDDSGKPGSYLVDDQRSFHVFIPNYRNKWEHKKRYTYLDGISASDEKLLRGKDDSRQKRFGSVVRVNINSQYY